MNSYEARKALDMSVITPQSSKEILNDALNELREYERKFDKLGKIKREKEVARELDEECNEMAHGYQLMRDTEIDLLEQILDEEF
jgi:hypothetical protein